MNTITDTIAALATAAGQAAIGLIRISGANAVPLADHIFKGKKISLQASHTAHFGQIVQGKDTQSPVVLDEVLLSVFRAPRTFTGEDIIEISAHGSPFVLQQILDLCLASGARLAEPGEFTRRAFLNGKIDLTQAEAVGDLIAADSAAAQQTALNQLRGGFSGDLNFLREQLISFAALIELELDFSQEDVAFADRKQLADLIALMQEKTKTLIESFRLGNAIKQGVRVAIIGKPNAGKSTLLNALLNEERAIVSDIAGTTRDTIEESLHINGILFRLIDTAGIRDSKGDVIEDIGIERAKANAAKADIIVHLTDTTEDAANAAADPMDWLDAHRDKVISVGNKYDAWTVRNASRETSQQTDNPQLLLSAKSGFGIDELKAALYRRAIGEQINTENTIVTNARHHDALRRVDECLTEIENGMNAGLSGELLALDIRRCLYFLGTITGQIEVDRDILGTIFGKFCIGK